MLDKAIAAAMINLVIGCSSDNEHRPLRPMLTPKGIRVAATESRDLRGFCVSGLADASAMQATGGSVSSGTGGVDPATPRRTVAKLALSGRMAGGSSLVRAGKVC